MKRRGYDLWVKQPLYRVIDWEPKGDCKCRIYEEYGLCGDTTEEVMIRDIHPYTSDAVAASINAANGTMYDLGSRDKRVL